MIYKLYRIKQILFCFYSLCVALYQSFYFHHHCLMSIFNVLLQSEVDSIKTELKGVVATQKALEEK